MNAFEKKETEKLVINAIEEYLNNHENRLMGTEINNMTSAYCLLDAYKEELIKRVYKEN